MGEPPSPRPRYNNSDSDTNQQQQHTHTHTQRHSYKHTSTNRKTWWRRSCDPYPCQTIYICIYSTRMSGTLQKQAEMGVPYEARLSFVNFFHGSSMDPCENRHA